jgi:hypothetical protein
VTRLTDDGRYHIDFMSADGSDIVLLSSDNIKFRTHSFILKTASGVFRTTLSLPQAAGTCPQESIIGPLQEDAQTISIILRMLCGMELPALDSFEEVEKVLVTSDKWDMPGPFSILRRITVPQALFDDPLRLYILACRFGWIEAAKAASTYTLDLDLKREDLQPLLHRMESRDLLKLQELRTRRRDALLEFLQAYRVRTCSHDLNSMSSRAYGGINLQEFPVRWEALKLKAFLAMERRPSGNSLFGSQSVIQSDIQALCVNCRDCKNTPAYDARGLTEAIQKELAQLPQSI